MMNFINRQLSMQTSKSAVVDRHRREEHIITKLYKKMRKGKLIIGKI